MNFLRASPSSFLSPAFALHDFMRSCCFFWASVGSFFAALSCASASGDAASLNVADAD